MRIRQFREDHWDRLPTIRLQKAVLDNFKSVEHGEIVFACGKKLFRMEQNQIYWDFMDRTARVRRVL